MSESVKETVEFLRGGGVVIARLTAAKADGRITNAEKVGIILSSLESVIDAFTGLGKIPKELKDVDELESEQIIGEMVNILRRSGKFTYRERDIAERLFRWFYKSVVEYDEITNLPVTAELLE